MKDDARNFTRYAAVALDAWARHAASANGFGDGGGETTTTTTTTTTRRTDMLMQVNRAEPASRYARTIEVSKRIRWDIDRDVIRGRDFDYTKKFLPDALSRIDRLPFLSDDERRFVSQVQGRTYANMFGMIERYIGAKIAEVSRTHALGDQVAFEALVRFTEEELKHQELFRRLEQMMAAGMPEGYRLVPDGNAVAGFVLGKSSWAVLGLTCHIELFTQAHYRASIDADPSLSPLFKDVFLYHWKEESQHAILDELEWLREDAKLSAEARDSAVDDLIALVGAVDGILQAQAVEDTRYCVENLGRELPAEQRDALAATFLAAYRWQYIVSGVQEPRFAGLLASLVQPEQHARIGTALAPIVAAS